MSYINLLFHILAALVWVGGLFFVVLVLRPAIGKMEPVSLKGELFDKIGRRFRLVGWIALGILIFTGLLNLHYLGITPDALLSLDAWSRGWGLLLAIKLILVVAVLILSYFHDFKLAPALTQKILEPDVQESEIEPLRRKVSWLARINGGLVIGIIGIAMLLARGGL